MVQNSPNQPLAYVSNSRTPSPDLIAAESDAAPAQRQALSPNILANKQVLPDGNEPQSSNRTPTSDAWARKYLLAFGN
jgi:hypothetical protein